MAVEVLLSKASFRNTAFRKNKKIKLGRGMPISILQNLYYEGQP